MPTLNWVGKDKVVNHHQEVPFKTLRHLYRFDAPDAAANSGGNRIIHGDNLEALKALLPEYEGRVKCIYIDPPYNTATKAGFSTTTSTIRSLKNGSARWSAKKAKTFHATTNGSA